LLNVVPGIKASVTRILRNTMYRGGILNWTARCRKCHSGEVVAPDDMPPTVGDSPRV